MNLELTAAFLCACLGVLLMYGPARENTTFAYESRRSSVLLEAARKEAENRRRRDRVEGPRDKSVVFLGEEWERLWWSDHFGVSPRTLKAAVREVGPMARDIRRHLRRVSHANRHHRSPYWAQPTHS